MSDFCKNCNARLSGDEIAIYKKVVSRNAKQYLCKSCLSDYFKVPVSVIEDRIEHFKKIGCTLFCKD